MFLSIIFTCIEFLSYIYVIVRLHRNYSQITLTDAIACLFYLVYGFWAMIFIYMTCFCVVNHIVALNIMRVVFNKFARSQYYHDFVVFVNKYQLNRIENSILVAGDILRNIMFGAIIRVISGFCDKEFMEIIINNSHTNTKMTDDEIRRFNDRVSNIIQMGTTTITHNDKHVDSMKTTIIKNVGEVVFGMSKKDK